MRNRFPIYYITLSLLHALFSHIVSYSPPFFIDASLPLLPQTDAEYEEMYMTYRNIDHGNYTKVYEPSLHGQDLPEAVDWRTNNAVTSVKDQVFLYT